MDAPIQMKKNCSHIRSTSLPSRSHPLTLSVEQQLCRLKITEEASSTPSSSSSACRKLCSLKDLYECVDDMLHTQLAQQSLSNERHECIEEVMEGSLRLLDAFGVSGDIFSQMKESVQDLESSLRRKRGNEDISGYMVSRKKFMKMAGKCLMNLKKKEKQHNSVQGDSSLEAVIGILREVEGVSFSVLESLLSLVSKPKARSKSSLVSFFKQSKRIACDGEEHNCSEVEKVDAALDSLNCHTNVKEVQNALKSLEALELRIQEIQEELDGVLRCLIKTRVSLLNILNN